MSGSGVSMSVGGALVGLLAGVGLVAVTGWLRDRRPRSLAQRVSLALPSAGPRPRPDATVRLRDAVTWALGPSVARRDSPDLAILLRRAGLPVDPTGHRLARIAWAGAAGAIGAVLGLLEAGALALVVGAMAATGGAWACDARLRHRARSRQQRMAAQLPLLADLTALAVTAGAGPVTALGTSADTMGGPLGQELGSAMVRIRAGEPIERSLRQCADDVGLPGLHRLVESLLVAIDHGTPVAGVARAQAEDLRSDDRRRLLESAGRRDIAMLVPIVALVLPSVVLVALYPGLEALRLLVL